MGSSDDESVQRPSYYEKLDWAAKHLQDLRDLIADARRRAEPIFERVTDDVDGNSVFVLRASDPLDRRLALVAGDFLSNLNASFEHLALALRPPGTDPRKATFPVVHAPLWASTSARDRGRWRELTKGMRPEAVSIIQGMQPITTNPPNFHCLDLLHQLARRDRHQRLHVVSDGFENLELEATYASGLIHGGTASELGPLEALAVGGRTTTAPGIVSLAARAALVIAIRGWDERYVRLPDRFDDILQYARDSFRILAPYDQSAASSPGEG